MHHALLALTCTAVHSGCITAAMFFWDEQTAPFVTFIMKVGSIAPDF